MANNSYALDLESVIIYKFGTLITGAPTVADKVNSLDITPQVQEVSVFESIFSPVMRAEIAIYDFIGLFVNFPLTGEEALFVTYRTIKDDTRITLKFVIDTIDNIDFSDAARETAYIIKCVALEAYANAKQTIQQGYENLSIPDVVKKIYNQHIGERIKKVYPAYSLPNFYVENNDVMTGTVVVPNMSPFAAISMLAEMCVSQTQGQYTYLFYQTSEWYNFRTLQGLFDMKTRTNARRAARNNAYVYQANELENKEDKNDGRVALNLIFNKRHSSLQKLSTGYFHNNLFEINIAQKAVWGQPTRVDDINTIYPNKLNTQNYVNLAYVEGNEEQSNRTKYVVTAQKENDTSFPVSRYRDKWGSDLIATAAMAQIDITVTVPGTSSLKAGDLFYLEIPEMHGFNDVKEDDLVSGLFVITEVKHILQIGGFHTTVLRLNKDSQIGSVDRASRYK